MAFMTRKIASKRLFLLFLFLLLGFLVLKFYIMTNPVQNAALKGLNFRTNKRRSKVDLVIVEEHHEVLEYWFDAAEKGIIPKSGNVLVHIDAHSDMAPPEIVEDFPSFRWPKNHQEITAMMQSNDVFIEGAAMSGLFKKVIWVWPSWDEESHEEDDTGHDMGGGWAVVTVDNEPEKTFCECEYKPDHVTKKRCYYVNRTAFVDEDYEGTPISAGKCKIVRKIVYQEIVDYNALNLIASGKLVGEGESLLLDIDEDFFGCVLRGKDLVDAGIKWSDIEDINSLLGEIFCPEAIQHEAIANSLMQDILALLIRTCKLPKDISKRCLDPKDPKHESLTDSLNKMFASFSRREILCDMDLENRNERLGYLLQAFLLLELNQLKVISEMGFCMQTSPRSYTEPGFQICHGANEPNSSIVTVHMPRENELMLRLSRLRRIIQSKSYPTPGMVTLCRSVRDGYTAVPYFKEIEKNVIDSIVKSRPGVKFNVIYDKNLLGGVKGWPSRKKIDFGNINKERRRDKRSVIREKYLN